MELRFWNDPETGLPHIYNHGVTEDEVHQVLKRPGLDFPEGRKIGSLLFRGGAGDAHTIRNVEVPD
jgi:hypothetical protein